MRRDCLGSRPAAQRRRRDRGRPDHLRSRVAQRPHRLAERGARGHDIVEHDDAAGCGIPRPKAARDVLAPPVLVEAALIGGAAGLDEQRRHPKTRPARRRGRPRDSRAAGTPRGRSGSARAPPWDERMPRPRRPAQERGARARPVRPSSLRARSTRPATPSNRSPLHTGMPRSAVGRAPAGAAAGRSASAQASHSATSGSPHPAHTTGSTSASASASAARTVAASQGMSTSTIVRRQRRCAESPAPDRGPRGARRGRLGRSRQPCGVPCCVASTRMPVRRLLPVGAASHVERAVLAPQPHDRGRRRHPRWMRSPPVAVVVAVGPPTSCSRTTDSSPSCDSTPTVVSSSQASADARARRRRRSAPGRPAAPARWSGVADDARDPDRAPRAGGHERGEAGAVPRHRHRRDLGGSRPRVGDRDLRCRPAGTR